MMLDAGDEKSAAPPAGTAAGSRNGSAGNEYDAAYYASGCGSLPYERNAHWLEFFGDLADNVIRSLNPRTVLDAGCAHGFLVESFWDRSVHAKGIDISSFAISQVRPDVAPYCRCCSLAEPIAERFDLVTCIEVLEHIAPDEAEPVIDNLAACTDTLLFSSTPSDFAEPTHVNVRPPAAWMQSFARAGLYPDITFDASFLTPHAILFRRREPLPEAVMVAYAQLLRYRIRATESAHSVAMEHQTSEALRSQVSDLEAMVHGLNGRIDGLQHTVAAVERNQTRIEGQLEFEQRRADRAESANVALQRRADAAGSNEDFFNEVIRRLLQEELRRTHREIHVVSSLINMTQTSKFWRLRTLFGRRK
ncbi:MAG: class I SAM-dependent methyltransferase [Candidatus Velthaea sp.]